MAEKGTIETKSNLSAEDLNNRVNRLLDILAADQDLSIADGLEILSSAFAMACRAHSIKFEMAVRNFKIAYDGMITDQKGLN